MKEQYYIDWINSLDIKDCIFINSIEELINNDNNILLNIISIILNKKVDELIKGKEFKNLNYIDKLSNIMKNYFGYSYEINNEINIKNNTILLIKFLKSKYPNHIHKNNKDILTSYNINTNNENNNNNKEKKQRPKSSKILRKKSEKKLNDRNDINEIKEKSNEKKMEEFILNYLFKIGIIDMNQRNGDYLWKKLIPDLKDGYIIGKLIIFLEKKSNNYLKGISNETFYKVNIYLNWKKIKDFLLNKEAFNSSYLYQKNFFEQNKNIFYLLYDICHYYYIEKEIKCKKNFCKRSISLNHIENKNKNSIKKIKDKIKLNEISSKEEIMKVRKSLNKYIKKNNTNNHKNIKRNNELNKVNINYTEKNNTKKDDIDNIIINNNKIKNKINKVLSFLTIIGINTSQINFYSKEMKIFKDGILFYKILSQLEQNKNLLPTIDLNPKQAPSAINNHKLMINYLIKYKKNFQVKFMGKEKELYKAKNEFVLEFLLEIKKAFKNEIYFFEKNKNFINIIYPKNIDNSERESLPLNNKLRNKFIVQDIKKIWA